MSYSIITKEDLQFVASEYFSCQPSGIRVEFSQTNDIKDLTEKQNTIYFVLSLTTSLTRGGEIVLTPLHTEYSTVKGFEVNTLPVNVPLFIKGVELLNPLIPVSEIFTPISVVYYKLIRA